MKNTVKIEDFEGTIALAGDFAREAAAVLAKMNGRSLVVTLDGDLGAGKTAFTQAVGAALGVARPITSPTFCLVSEYETKYAFQLVHMDLYRLHDEDDVLAIGWEDYLSQGALVMVEWPGRAGDLIPPDAWRISISATGETSRTFDIEKPGEL